MQQLPPELMSYIFSFGTDPSVVSKVCALWRRNIIQGRTFDYITSTMEHSGLSFEEASALYMDYIENWCEGKPIFVFNK